MSALVGRRLAARAGFELIRANLRYWSTVAPVVRAELSRWRERAAAIDDPELRDLALAKLSAEAFNARAGAMLATLAPRARRVDVARAIVALELLFDLLDGLTERPLSDPLRDGERLFGPFTDALELHPAREPSTDAGVDSYLEELSVAAGRSFTRLRAAAAVMPAARPAAARAAQAQVRMHAVARLGSDQLQQWAEAQPPAGDLGWREFVAGSASSVLAVHALIAAASHPHTTPAEAAELDRAYLSICVLLTLLDGLVDRDADAHGGELAYVDLWPQSELPDRVASVARRAVAQVVQLPDAGHHVMTLTGVIAYYASAPGAASPAVQPIVVELRRAMGPLIVPTLVLMRAWRLAARARRTP